MYAEALNFWRNQGIAQKYYFRTKGLFACAVVEEVGDRRERRVRGSDFRNVIV